MADNSEQKTACIRSLNDALRRCGSGGRIMMTAGIDALGSEKRARVLSAVAAFDNFNEDNDPYEEHDCATLRVADIRVLFKIDLYEEPEVKAADGQPATTRVLTIMLADEW